jgi:AcrR family transcriptional regulator
MSERAEVSSDGPRATIEPRYRKLKPGPGRPHDEVVAHQRSRILAALIELSAEHGYAAVTVRDLSRAAGVSKASFYAQFHGKEDCFTAAYDRVLRQAARAVLVSEREGRIGRERLRAALAALGDELAAQPAAARLVLVESLAAGPAVRARVNRRMGLFESLVASRFASVPGGIEMPRLLAKAVVAGVAHVARGCLLDGRPEDFPAQVEALLDWALSFNDAAALDLVHYGPRATRGLRPPTGEPPGHSTGGSTAERDLILTAAARIAAREGYAELTATRIRADAGVSRRGFEANFTGVADCFFAAIGERADLVLAEAEAAYEGASSWEQGVLGVLGALTEGLARDPILARLAFVELFGSGAEAVRWRQDLISAIAERLRRSAPPGQQPGVATSEASMGAIWEIVRRQVAAGRTKLLPRETDLLAFLALAPVLGARQAQLTIQVDADTGDRGSARMLLASS